LESSSALADRQRQTTRVLSLDGGGTWALIQARALQKLFTDDTAGWVVLEAFDVVVANSGGSIVAGGLVANKKLSEIVALFEDLQRRESVFQRKAFDYDRERATFFRTNSKSLSSSSDASFLDAIHASTTPPVIFFDQPARWEASDGVHRYWDGAMAGYNNPTMAGVVEILANAAEEPIRSEGVRVLSLGTATVPRPAGYRSPTGLVNDVRKAAMSILDDPPDTASFEAHVTLHGAIPDPGRRPVADGPVVRMSPVARVGTPGVTQEEYDALSSIHLDAVEQQDVDRISSLAESWLRDDVPNQPIRPATGNDPADIGHDRFSEAKAAYLAWP
jgi:hypothetical protein